jgi:hypothetical protein
MKSVMGAWNFTWKKEAMRCGWEKKSSAARAFLRFFLLLQTTTTTTTGGKNIKNKEEVYSCGLHPFTREKPQKVYWVREKRLDVNLAPGVVVVPSERYVHLYNHLGCCFPSTQEKNIRDDAAPRKILKRKLVFFFK